MRHKVTILFNYYGYHGGGMAGSIFDKKGLAPTLSTMQGGGREPMIIEYDETK